jgi:hypothetical protein
MLSSIIWNSTLAGEERLSAEAAAIIIQIQIGKTNPPVHSELKEH